MRSTRFPTALAWPGLLLLCVALGACGGKEDGSTVTAVEAPSDSTLAEGVPEDIPFDPAEWTTATDYPLIGDPRALRVSDKPFELIWNSFPPTLRPDGPNSNLVSMRHIHLLLYDSLIDIHPDTEEFIPRLASHWRIETDEEGGTQTLWFRLDPRARFSDGNPVTARDVYWSWWHKTQEDRNDPSNVITFTDYEEPEVLDRYTIRVKTKELNWRLFLYFGGMLIFPENYIRIPGEQYLSEYNWKFMPGSGPYEMTSLKKGETLVLTRRDDWWAEDERWAKYCYNFKQIKFSIIRDMELQYEKFKAGELDYYRVARAQRWAEEIPQERIVQMGWVQRRKVYNHAPEGFAGIAFNMRKPPFDDKRVRLAFCYLFNLDELMRKFFFNEYDYINSYFPGRDWGAGDTNEPIRFDPDLAEELLAEAGYVDRNEDGFLVGPDGNVLEVTMRYALQSWERIWLTIKEGYEDAGVKFNLELIDSSTLVRKISDRQFTVHFQSWGALLFPNPETTWRSDLAEKPNNNNIVGFQDERVDELLLEYNKTFDRELQKEITREIDRIVYAEHPYALAWFASHERILFWDKFGYPETYFNRIEQRWERDMVKMWWWDPEREAALQEAMANDEAIPQGQVVHRPWDD
ncbi:MAG: ABC transporter substrate-binding protein [Planctomycetota bacterium]